MIEDDFYAHIKLITGEELFARVSASEEEDRTMLVTFQSSDTKRD